MSGEDPGRPTAEGAAPEQSAPRNPAAGQDLLSSADLAPQAAPAGEAATTPGPAGGSPVPGSISPPGLPPAESLSAGSRPDASGAGEGAVAAPEGPDGGPDVWGEGSDPGLQGYGSGAAEEGEPGEEDGWEEDGLQVDIDPEGMFQAVCAQLKKLGAFVSEAVLSREAILNEVGDPVMVQKLNEYPDEDIPLEYLRDVVINHVYPSVQRAQDLEGRDPSEYSVVLSQSSEGISPVLSKRRSGVASAASALSGAAGPSEAGPSITSIAPVNITRPALGRNGQAASSVSHLAEPGRRRSSSAMQRAISSTDLQHPGPGRGSRGPGSHGPGSRGPGSHGPGSGQYGGELVLDADGLAMEPSPARAKRSASGGRNEAWAQGRGGLYISGNSSHSGEDSAGNRYSQRARPDDLRSRVSGLRSRLGEALTPLHRTIDSSSLYENSRVMQASAAMTPNSVDPRFRNQMRATMTTVMSENSQLRNDNELLRKDLGRARAELEEARSRAAGQLAQKNAELAQKSGELSQALSRVQTLETQLRAQAKPSGGEADALSAIEKLDRSDSLAGASLTGPSTSTGTALFSQALFGKLDGMRGAYDEKADRVSAALRDVKSVLEDVVSFLGVGEEARGPRGASEGEAGDEGAGGPEGAEGAEAGSENEAPASHHPALSRGRLPDALAELRAGLDAVREECAFIRERLSSEFLTRGAISPPGSREAGTDGAASPAPAGQPDAAAPAPDSLPAGAEPPGSPDAPPPASAAQPALEDLAARLQRLEAAVSGAEASAARAASLISSADARLGQRSGELLAAVEALGRTSKRNRDDVLERLEGLCRADALEKGQSALLAALAGVHEQLEAAAQATQEQLAKQLGLLQAIPQDVHKAALDTSDALQRVPDAVSGLMSEWVRDALGAAVADSVAAALADTVPGAVAEAVTGAVADAAAEAAGQLEEAQRLVGMAGEPRGIPLASSPPGRPGGPGGHPDASGIVYDGGHLDARGSGIYGEPSASMLGAALEPPSANASRLADAATPAALSRPRGAPREADAGSPGALASPGTVDSDRPEVDVRPAEDQSGTASSGMASPGAERGAPRVAATVVHTRGQEEGGDDPRPEPRPNSRAEAGQDAVRDLGLQASKQIMSAMFKKGAQSDTNVSFVTYKPSGRQSQNASRVDPSASFTSLGGRGPRRARRGRSGPGRGPGGHGYSRSAVDMGRWAEEGPDPWGEPWGASGAPGAGSPGLREDMGRLARTVRRGLTGVRSEMKGLADSVLDNGLVMRAENEKLAQGIGEVLGLSQYAGDALDALMRAQRADIEKRLSHMARSDFAVSGLVLVCLLGMLLMMGLQLSS